MVEKRVKILNRVGLHARPAALLVQTASKFASDIYLEKDRFRVDGKSIIGVLTLAAERGSEITIIAEGADEEKAVGELASLVNSRFSEE